MAGIQWVPALTTVLFSVSKAVGRLSRFVVFLEKKKRKFAFFFSLHAMPLRSFCFPFLFCFPKIKTTLFQQFFKKMDYPAQPFEVCKVECVTEN